MYVDLVLLFLIYAFSVISMAVSIYALWTLKEVEEWYKTKNSKPNNAWDHYHSKAKQKTRTKVPGHWD
jgi:hypothetical protein